MSVLPVPGQVRTAVALAAARMATLRGATARAGAWVALVMVCLTLVMAGAAGDLLREATRRQLSDTLTPEQARAALRFVVLHPDQVLLAAAAAVAATVVLTVAAQQPGRLLEVPYGHLVTTGPLTRFLESLLTGLVSVVPVTQLLALTAAASLLTVDRSGRGAAIAVAWLTWVLVQVATTALLWAVTLLRRARDPRTTRRVVAGSLAALTAAVAAVATGAVTTAAAVVAGTHPLLWLPVLAAATAAAWRTGVGACERAGRLAPVLDTQHRHRSVRVGATPWRAVLTVTAAAVWRTRNVRAPMLSVAGLSALSLLVLPDSGFTLPGVALGIPLAWALLLTSNFLAVHGTGTAWLGTLPRAGSPLLGAAVVLGLTGSLLPALLVPLPALAAGTLQLDRLGAYLMLNLSASVLLTATAVLLAVLAPQPRDLAREALLSPARAVASMLLLGALGALVWLAVGATAALAHLGGTWRSAPTLGAAATGLAGAAVLGVTLLVWPRIRTRSTSLAGAR